MSGQSAITLAPEGHDVLVGRQAEHGYLARMLDDVRRGNGRSAVVSGEPGIGKTALLDHLCRRTGDTLILRAAGVPAEQGFAYAALHHLLGAFLDRADTLVEPLRMALRVAFGVDAGEPPDPLAVSQGTLALLRALSAERPVVCVVDDQHWLDEASTRALSLVSRRLDRDKVGLLFAATAPARALTALPEIRVRGLSASHAGELLDAVLVGPVDPAVRRRMVAEADGNPSTLLQMAAAFGPFGPFDGPASRATAQSQQLEAAYRARLERLPERSRHLVQLAAVDPVGEPGRLWAAAALLGLDRERLATAVEQGFIVVGSSVYFGHPLARAAAFRMMSPAERRAAHAALAAVTDVDTDPDRRAWHRAEAADSPDEAVAHDLDRFAGRARRRGGLAAAAAFRRKAAALTPDKRRQAVRLISAAEAAREAGALDTALDLLELIDEAVVDERLTPRLLRLRCRIAWAQQRPTDAVRDLLACAGQLAADDPGQGREVCLEALVGTIWTAGPDRLSEVAGATFAIAPADAPDAIPTRVATVAAPSLADDTVAVLLNGLRALAVEGYAAAAPELRRAMDLLAADPDGSTGPGGSPGPDPAVPSPATLYATLLLPVALWDAEAWPRLIDKVLAHARGNGALGILACALDSLAVCQMWTGDLAAAGAALDQACRLHAATTGAVNPYNRTMLAAWRGDEARTLQLAAEARSAPGPTSFAQLVLTDYAEAVLCNGTGRFEQAHAATCGLLDTHPPTLGALVASELADAASRCGAVADLRRLETWLLVRVRATPGPWVVGIAERVQALLSTGDEAETHYQASIEQLRRTGSRTELARSELLYGEWLRRRGRRGSARQVLREAYHRFRAIGAGAFAERSARELRATGDPSVREVTADYGRLTAQEAQIAALAGEGLTNPEIGARLFISSRTVQHHLRHVFQKLGITSRTQLPEPTRVAFDGALGG
ncbi:LuxR family transcriptional regulator [Actinoallomurus vinaceus]|uniref:LuxR family transcriptional regulator n=1 Tax=Actinoallomurus vinaceus TaxID=1080074 RepID=A0ABP8TZM2_9ACTN